MKALVTGGGGFLGGAIVRMLTRRGDCVRSFSRGSYPDLTRLGVESVSGDLADAQAVARACEGVDVVFHVAAKAGIAGSRIDFHRANVVGTRNVLDACLSQGIDRLVFTSSPSVVFDGRDMEGADESAPYPARYHAFYPETKAEAERRVLAANSPKLATVALRPHLIWGPGDNNLIPRIIARARAGSLRRLGREDKKVDGTYIDNAAHAHLLAADRLLPGSPISGKVYFVAQGEPIGMWELINRILAEAGEPPVTRSISPRLAYCVGTVLELVHKVLRLTGEPRMTRFLAGELSTAHWFDLTAARRDLGYTAQISTGEGLTRLGRWLRGSL